MGLVERENPREKNLCSCVCVYIYIYIYILNWASHEKKKSEDKTKIKNDAYNPSSHKTI